MLKKIFAALAVLASVHAQADDQANAPLQFHGVEGFEAIPETCSFTTIWDHLSHFMPTGQIEGVRYISSNPETLKSRVAPYLKTEEQQAEFNRWLAQTPARDLRMRAKEVRFNQWGGQGADEWVMFCSKGETSIYLLHRNLWVE